MPKVVAIILLFFAVILTPAIWLGLRINKQVEDKCAKYRWVATGGGHAPYYCYDPKTRLVYKPM